MCLHFYRDVWIWAARICACGSPLMFSRNVADMLTLARAAHRVKPSFEVFCSSLSGAESVDGFRSHGVKDVFVLQPALSDSGVFRTCQRRMPSCSRRCHGGCGVGRHCLAWPAQVRFLRIVLGQILSIQPWCWHAQGKTLSS